MENLPPCTELTSNLEISTSISGVIDGSGHERSRSIKKCFGIKKMYIAALSALFLALTLGLHTGYSAPATYDMAYRSSSRVKPTDNEITWIGSVLGLGVMTGSVLAGPVSDKIGRKDTLIFNVVPSVLGWLIICYAKSALVIIIARFICGVASGVMCVVIPMYCVEISTAEVRGIFGSGFQGFLVIGNLISVVIGSYITWDYLAMNGAIFSIFGTICFCFMPESPRWLLSKGRLKEAIRVMHDLQGGHTDAEKECNAIYKDLECQPKGKLTLKEFKHPTVYKPTLIALSLFFFSQFSGQSVVFFYSSQIFEIGKNFMDPKKSTIIIGAVQVVVTLFSNIIVDKVGRKVLLILSGALMALAHLTLGIYYSMSSTDAYFQIKYSWIPLASLNLYVIAFSIGFGPITFLLTAELLPVRARSKMSGLISFVNGIFAFIVSKTFSDLQVLLKMYGTFWFYSSMSLLGIIFVFFIVPETKGKKLEEIEEIFRSRQQIDKSIDIAVVA